MGEELHLAIETSSPRGSIALGRGGELIASHALQAVRKHTGELLPAIRDLLAAAGHTPRDVGVVCFSQGPGSFTGLRVAATVARMWQMTTGARVVGVSSLEVIARNALTLAEPPLRVAVVLDGRQGKVFGAVYERAEAALRNIEPPALHLAEAWWPALEPSCAVLGDGVTAHRAALAARGLQVLPEALWWPVAAQVLAIGRGLAAAGQFLSPGQIVPHYLRPPECEEVYEQRRAAARERRGE